MNEQDRETLDDIWPSVAAQRSAVTERIEARLAYIKLEQALAWVAGFAGGVEWHPDKLVYHEYRGNSLHTWYEPHDDTTRARGEALVRLHSRVTGGEKA